MRIDGFAVVAFATESGFSSFRSSVLIGDIGKPFLLRLFARALLTYHIAEVTQQVKGFPRDYAHYRYVGSARRGGSPD